MITSEGFSEHNYNYNDVTHTGNDLDGRYFCSIVWTVSIQQWIQIKRLCNLAHWRVYHHGLRKTRLSRYSHVIRAVPKIILISVTKLNFVRISVAVKFFDLGSFTGLLLSWSVVPVQPAKMIWAIWKINISTTAGMRFNRFHAFRITFYDWLPMRDPFFGLKTRF